MEDPYSTGLTLAQSYTLLTYLAAKCGERSAYHRRVASCHAEALDLAIIVRDLSSISAELHPLFRAAVSATQWLSLSRKFKQKAAAISANTARPLSPAEARLSLKLLSSLSTSYWILTVESRVAA
jgi:hypothetical protein